MVSSAESKEAQKKAMKGNTDPLVDSISYSGADITAVVFLPMDEVQVMEEKSKARSELDSLRREYETAIASLNSTSNEYARLSNSYDACIVKRDTYTPWSDDWVIWNNQALAINDQMSRVHFTLRTLNDKYPAGKLAQMEAEIQAAQARYNKLDVALSKGNMNDGYVNAYILGNLQTITYSIHREKFPVRTLGRTYPKSYTRGPRTIAGSMIFTVIDKHILWELLQKGLKMYSTGVGLGESQRVDIDARTILVDQLPPFDITLLFSNEVGDNSYMVLYGVEIVNEGQTMSIQDLLTENVVQFVARDIDPLMPINEARRILNSDQPTPKTATDILGGAVNRRKDKMNPFL